MADERNRAGESLSSRLSLSADSSTALPRRGMVAVSLKGAARGGIEPKAEVTRFDVEAGAQAIVADAKKGNAAPPCESMRRLPPERVLVSDASTSAKSERAAGDQTAWTSAHSNEAANWAAKCGLTGDEERCSNGWSMRALLDELIVDAAEDSSGDDEASENEPPPSRMLLLLLLMLAWPPLPLFESVLGAAAIVLFA
jgi:hypothetical protein